MSQVTNIRFVGDRTKPARPCSGLFGATLVVALGFSLPAFSVDLEKQVDFNIPAESLAAALITFSHQAKVQVVITDDLTRQVSQKVTGQHSIGEALGQLLAGKGLKYRISSNTSITILRQPEAAPATSGNTKEGDATTDSSMGTTQASSSAMTSGDRDEGRNQLPLDEIVVTAQKRLERLQDVPVPVTAVGVDTLLNSNELRLQDYYTRVPGLNITTDDFGTPLITIRGLTTGAYTNPTVGFVVDDVPYGASSAGANGQQVPDIDPNDLSRIEVLRGPQGTLYGASSLGGLIKFVTVDPSTDGVSGRIQASTEAVRNGAQLGYGVRGSINVPLSETTAIRASGFTRQDPGYSDNIQTGENGVNVAEVYGARLSAMWRPSAAFTLKLTGLIQDNQLKGSAYVDLPVNGYVGLASRDLQQDNLRDTGWLRQSIRAFSANLNAKLGAVDVTSVTGYNVNTLADSFDASPFYAELAQATFGVPGSPLVTRNRTYKLTQELRVSGGFSHGIDWLVGGFYNHENSPGSQDTLATNPQTGALAGVGAHYSNPSTFQEYAGFADLTFHFGERFDVQLGGRESENHQSLIDTRTGPYFPPFAYPKADSKDDSFTYLITPRLRIYDDLMLYARLASGYRPGGPNAGVSGNIPTSFKPDKTQNYEVGAKGDVLSQRLSFDVSLYRIDWKDVQLFLVDPISEIAYNANGSQAKSQGIELSIEAKPIRGVTISSWAAWNDAKLTEPLPPNATVSGAAGDRLPYTSRFSGNLSVEGETPLTKGLLGTAGLTMSYVGNRQGIFTPVPPRQDFAGYAKTDLHIGVKHDTIAVNVYVNNLADKRGILNGGIGTFLPYTFQYLQPRTVGISLVDSF